MCDRLYNFTYHINEAGPPVANSLDMLLEEDNTEVATRSVLWKKVFLEVLQNSQENTCARVSFLNKVAGLRPATLVKKRFWHMCFPVNFASI